MQTKKKICKGRGKFEGLGCGTEQYIYGHGLCRVCYQRANYKPISRKKYEEKNTHYKSILKFRPTIQDEIELKQTDTFLLAWNYWQGKYFIGFGHVRLEDLQAWNCIHVLDKKNYHYFKYYYKNIILGSREQHTLIDQGTWDQIELRILTNPKESREMWDAYFRLREELLIEYKAWVLSNHGIYKLG